MADEARPLSRRERREMEEQAAAGLTPVPEPSSAPPGRDAPVEEALDASGLSRRDRRRLERLEQPMETWTAVEEMHHTGQVPMMTPEVIAQQEELARRRAAEAQADAVAATGELHQVAPHQVTAPVISRYDMPDEPPEPPRPAPSGPGDDARRRLAQAAADAAAQLPAERERPAMPPRREPGIIDAPRPLTAEVPSLADLTPPSGIRGPVGPFPQGAPAPLPLDGFPVQGMPNPPTGSVPSPYPLGAPPPPYNGAPLAPETPPVGQPQAAGAPMAPPASQPQAAGPPMAPPAAQPRAPGAPTTPPAGQPQPPGAPMTPPSGQPQPPAAQAVAPPVASPPIPAPAHPSAPLPVTGQVVSGAPQGVFGTPPPPNVGPPTGAIPVQGGPGPYPPGTALSPIVTGMLRPVPGATGTMRAIPGAGPMTGTIPRPVIEVQPAGGAKEFGWPHIALLAAAAFVLGLVVWKISGLGG